MLAREEKKVSVTYVVGERQIEKVKFLRRYLAKRKPSRRVCTIGDVKEMLTTEVQQQVRSLVF